jgi:phosphoglycolate phosphatase-like HAD superfamily hydrolase
MADRRGIILDIDGTLIDSNDAHASAWVDAGRELGHPMEWDEVRPLIGMGGDRVMPRVAGVELDSPEGRRLHARRGEIFRGRYLPEIGPVPGARALVQRLRDDGFDVVVATSASAEDLRGLLDAAGVADLIRTSTTASDADASKPAPDIVEGAIARANAPREGLLMIGDTPYDVEAARRARVPILGVRSGGWDATDLDGAEAVYDHLEDVLDHYVEAILDRASGSGT